MAGGRNQAPDSESGGFFVEFQTLGNAVRVAAIDPETGIEVSIVGDPRAGEGALAQLAVAKLRRRLAKGDDDPSPPSRPAHGACGNRGLIV